MFRYEHRKHQRHSERSARPNAKQAEGRTEKHGLFSLSSPRNALTDVIAIHGLGGDAFSTWTDRHGHMWLRDALPRDLPRSNIWTYGYDSAVALSGSVSSIQDFARDLLERLLGIQASEKQTERPHIFICHSLGGIQLLKAALVEEINLRTSIGPPGLTPEQVVEPASAVLGIANERPIPMDADHRNMVRFSPNQPEQYRPLKNALIGIVGKIETDGLDETSNSESSSILGQFMEIIRSLNSSQRTQRVKLLVFSRPNHVIDKTLSGSNIAVLDMGRDQTSRDLQTFVSAVVPEFGNENNFPESAISRIQDRILAGADGMFLWAHLAWEHFKEGVTVWNRARIKSQLDSLGQLPHGLEKLYEKLLKSIDKNTRAELEPAFIVICAAARPLTCEELGEILAIESWHQNASEIDAPFAIETTILKLCPNLFKIDLDGIISFVHLSLKTFLLEVLLHLDSKVIHQYLARKVLRYFNFEDFRKDVIKDRTREKYDGCLLHQRYTLYDYFTSFLKFHMEQIPYTDPTWIQYSKLGRDCDVFHAIAMKNHTGLFRRGHADYYSPQDFGAETPLRHVLRLGALDLVRTFSHEGYSVDERVHDFEDHSATALHKYITDRTKASLLLEMGADPNAKDLLDRTALHLAINYEQQDLMKELLAHPNIDVNAEDWIGQTPLHYQASTGSFPTLLYDRRVDLGKVNKAGITAFASNALWGGKTAFRCFVEHPDFAFDRCLGVLSPLICAAQQDWKDLTLLLIRRVSDANLHRGLDGKSIVHWAVINGWDDLLQAALSHAKANVNAIDHSGKTGLHYAAHMNRFSIVRQLLRHGASARIQDNAGRTAVHTAAVEGCADALRPLILESDFESDVADEQKRSIIHWVASCDWQDLMKMVLEIPEIDPKKRDHHGRTASHVAALCGCPNVLRALVDCGAFDAADTDAFGNTSLHLAARGQSLTAVEVLLPHFHVHKHRINRWGQTARDVAAVYGSHDVEAMLRDEGLRLQMTPVSVKPVHSEDVLYSQTPNHLALVKQDYSARAPDRLQNHTEQRSGVRIV
ncbi:MAG: hypothetical protein Q9223_002642 [Gallowayella weberi]